MATERDPALAVSTPSSERAKALPLGAAAALTRSGEPDTPLVPARMVNEVLYCERLMYLEWVQSEWAGNAFTADGTRVHKRVDASRKRLKKRSADEASPAIAVPEAAPESPYQARSVWLSSERLGLTAKLDVVDVDGGRAVAVEFKRGKRPNLPEGAYLPERAQLCAHVLLLREHGYECDEAEIYFAGDRQRTRVEITPELVTATLGAVARARELAAGGQCPPPLEDSPKCGRCSLNVICLPDEVNRLRPKRLPLLHPAAAEEALAPSEPPPSLEAPEVPPVRRLQPTRDDRVPLYVTTQGATVQLDGERLNVYADGEKLAEARLPNTSHLALVGNVQISTQAVRSLLSRGVPIHYFTFGGWWAGSCTGADSNNVELRIAQYRASQDPAQCLALAKRWVHSKIANSRTLLRRNHRSPDQVVLNELKILARKALSTDKLESLLGIEGTAARTYFQSFTGMLSDASVASGYQFDGRTRRPPTDRMNALLSFCYALLTKDLLLACRAAGLDPLLGFYHQPRFGRPSLALDLMEEFRPIVADSVVLNAVNNGVIQYDDFIEATGSVALKDGARKRLIQVYEQRLDDAVTHPVFGYRISYRQVLEVQARLLGRVLLGEIAEYPIFRTR
jgi:CRISP-associated protein Cas1